MENALENLQNRPKKSGNWLIKFERIWKKKGLHQILEMKLGKLTRIWKVNLENSPIFFWTALKTRGSRKNSESFVEKLEKFCRKTWKPNPVPGAYSIFPIMLSAFPIAISSRMKIGKVIVQELNRSLTSSWQALQRDGAKSSDFAGQMELDQKSTKSVQKQLFMHTRVKYLVICISCYITQ